MKTLGFLVILLLPVLALANEKFISKIKVPHVDQFTATSLVNEGYCIAGASFVLNKGGLHRSLPKKIEKRLDELGANAWVLIDYRYEGITKIVKTVLVLPLQCDMASKEKDTGVKS